MPVNVYTKRTTWFFFAMAVFAVVFAKERFQADGAHYLLHVVQSENFRIEHQRYILAFSQLLPLIGIKAGASMDIIIILNSLNPVLWFYLLFSYATFYLKDRTAGIGIVLCSVLGVLHIQFTPMYEIYYGVPLVILLYSHLRNSRTGNYLDVLFFLLILTTALFAHPLIPVAVVFAFTYHAAEERKLKWKIIIPSLVIAGGWYLTKRMMLTDYEAGKLSLMGAEWNDSPNHLLHPEYYFKLFVFFIKWYTVPSIIVLLTMLFLSVRRMKLQLIAVAVFYFGHILLINYTHENYPDLTPYFERMYLPLIPIAIIPFLFTVCRELQMRPSFIVITLVAIVGWRLILFCETGGMYQDRTHLTEQIIAHAQKNNGTKFQLAHSDETGCYNWTDWSFPMETLLRSSAESSFRTVSIVRSDDLSEGNNSQILKNDEFLFRRWEIMKDSDLNESYFRMDNGKYIQLSPVCKWNITE